MQLTSKCQLLDYCKQAALMPVQYGFPPEAPQASAQDDVEEVIVDSPMPGDKALDNRTPSKVQAPAAKKRGRGSGPSTGAPAAKKSKGSRA